MSFKYELADHVIKSCEIQRYLGKFDFFRKHCIITLLRVFIS